MIIETIVIVPWPTPPKTVYTIMKRATLLGRNAAIQKLIAPNIAPAMHNDLQPQMSMNPATNIPTNCVTPYNTKEKSYIWSFYISLHALRSTSPNLPEFPFSLPDPIIDTVTWSELNCLIR